jgi:hypothetical protein
MIIRLRSPQADKLVFRWGNTISNIFAQSRTIGVNYLSNTWQTAVVPLKGHTEWDSQTITRMRVNPADTLADFEIDWMRGSTGDFDGDSLPDTYEADNGYNAADASDALVDDDGDGLNRQQEYILGTSDADLSSVFQLTAQAQTDGAMSVTWNGKAGREYRLWRSFTLQPGSWTLIHSTGPLTADTVLEFNDPSADGATSAFYRVEAVLSQP